MMEKFPNGLAEGMRKTAEAELAVCGEQTAHFGLTLSGEQIGRLVERRYGALRDTGRVEPGGGILPKLAYAFCDSPYVLQESWEETLAELQDAFYAYKNESRERLSDDELIEVMKRAFDGRAGGSTDYFGVASLADLCKNTRYGEQDDSDDEEELF